MVSGPVSNVLKGVELILEKLLNEVYCKTHLYMLYSFYCLCFSVSIINCKLTF